MTVRWFAEAVGPRGDGARSLGPRNGRRKLIRPHREELRAVIESGVADTAGRHAPTDPASLLDHPDGPASDLQASGRGQPGDSGTDDDHVARHSSNLGARLLNIETLPLSQVTIHGHDVRYRRAGGGGAIVLIHGLDGSSLAWEPVMGALAEHYDVIAPDLLGHGESAKPMGDYSLGAMASGLRDLLAILEVDRATIVGQSFGGGVAMQLAYQHPDQCSRLVLVGSGGLGREVSWLLRLSSLPGAEQLMPLIFPRFVASAGSAVGGFLYNRGMWALS